MLLKSLNPATFLSAVKKCVRKDVGRALTPVLKRWRNTRSDDSIPALTGATERFLVRVGILDAGDVADLKRKTYSDFIQTIERATGEAPGLIDAWLNAFSGGAYGLKFSGICGDKPQCTVCPIKANCRFLDAGAQEKRLFGVLEAAGVAAEKNPGRVPEDSSKMAHRVPSAPGSAADILAVLVSTGKSGAGKAAEFEALLKHYGGLRGLLSADLKSGAHADLNRDEVVRLQAISDICQLWRQELEPRGKQFKHGGDFFEAYHLLLRAEKKEKFYVICLDQKHRRLGDELVSEGSLTETLVHPREVFAPAIRLRAAAVAVIHNHPSGDPTPSPEDRQMTERLTEAADLVGIPLLDHIVIGDGKYVSFVDKGWI